MNWKDLFPKNNRYFETNNGILYCGDAKDILQQFPSESVDLVLTDPPYPKKYFYTYEYLANYCPRLMRNGSSLLMIVGHYAIPDVVKIFNKKLKYRWIFCMNQEKGNHPRMSMGIEVMWKPILWYVKKAFSNRKGFIKDMVKITKNDGIKKKYHKWQQSEEWVEFFISKLIFAENNIILDPYFGSGTVGFVAEKLNRRWVGIEINPEYCEIAKKRILEVVK